MNWGLIMKTLIRLTLTFATALISAPCAVASAGGSGVGSADGVEVRAVSADKEQYERDVDSVARASQEQAIAKLSTLLKKYHDTSQEPVLLEKLADFQQQDASILFRIAHGKSHRGNTAVDLTHFKKTMNQAIETLTRLISKYPSYSDIAHAYFLRGKSYEELENKIAAAKDYTFLVNRFPLADEVIPAYMSLADFAIDENNHAKAISFLKEVEKHPDDAHYPFALYKLAWSYYNLKDIQNALGYAERQVHYYNDLRTQNPSETPDAPTIANSDDALRENTILDATVFYFEGYEQDPLKYSPTRALDYFRNLEAGALLGRMYLRFSKLLRSHAHDSDLVLWKNLVLKDELDGKFHYGETLDVVVNTYEHLQDRRNWSELTKAAQDVVALYGRAKAGKSAFPESMPRAQKMILDTAESLQAVIVKNKESDEAKALSTTLASIYSTFVQIVDEADPRIPGAHYNLAETLFAIKDFDGATVHYRWIVDHENWKTSPVKGSVSVTDASLKAISSRYEVLQKSALIPKEIKAISIALNSEASLKPELKEWVDWIDEHLRHSTENTDTFAFEANRALYDHGHIVTALQRLTAFAEDHPKSSLAIPSASLVIDTYIATADWSVLLKKSEDFRSVSEWKSAPFSQKLFAVSADASYKLIEEKAKQKNYADTITGVDRFLLSYAKSERLGDALVLAGTASVESKQDELAVKYFTRLIAEVPHSKSLTDAFNARAQIEENHYQYNEAAKDYLAYLKASQSAGKPDPAMQRKILALIWIDGDWSALKSALANSQLCDAALEGTQKECGRYLALGALVRPDLFEFSEEEAFAKARKETGEIGALWAAVSLQNAKDLAFRDRLLAIRHLAQSWDELDPLVKLSVLPYLNDAVPAALAMDRKMISEVAPLRADVKYITHRVDIIREMENAVTLAMRLPWARIKAGAMNELASTYLDFCSGLSNIQPKGLEDKELALYQDTVRKIVIPFEEKGQDLRGKAFQMASDYAIETTQLQSIADPFFADNPSQAKKFRKPAQASVMANSIDLDLGFMDIVDNSTGWKKIKPGVQGHDRTFATEFVRSLQEQNWPKLAFLLQEAKAKSAFKAPVLAAMRAISMVSLGAQAEGLIELEQTREQWEGKTKIFVLGALSQYFERSYAVEHAQNFQKEIQTELNSPEPSPSSSTTQKQQVSLNK
jgi:TolA-binding protein